jgi:hypothetical protein
MFPLASDMKFPIASDMKLHRYTVSAGSQAATVQVTWSFIWITKIAKPLNGGFM